MVPSLPEVGPYTLLRGVWKPAHTSAVLEASGDVDPLVRSSHPGLDLLQQ